MFGIAEYIKEILIKNITGHFVITFDESLNKKSQSKRMDIHVRYWNNNKSKVESCFLGSQFLGHGTANDMLKHFNKGVLEILPGRNLLQVSMDGPNVNWKFHDMLSQQIKNDFYFSLINIGLHVVHNAFKAGAVETGWDLSSFLSSLYYLFKDSPARREDFVKVTESDKMPLKFVSHRRLENGPVCDRVCSNVGQNFFVCQESRVKGSF